MLKNTCSLYLDRVINTKLLIGPNCSGQLVVIVFFFFKKSYADRKPINEST